MKKDTAHSKPAVSVDTFRDDPLYPRIARAVGQLLARGKVVAPVDVLVGMNLLAPERLQDWRRGRVPYLEKVINIEEAMVGRADAEELQKTVVNRNELAGFHPTHVAYVYAQNQVSVMSEQLTALDEMARFVKVLSQAEDEYMPSGLPISPLMPSLLHVLGVFRCLRWVGQADHRHNGPGRRHCLRHAR